MKRRGCVVLLLCAFAGLFLGTRSAPAQLLQTHFVIFNFNQSPNSSGGFDYSLLANHSAFNGVPAEYRLTAPDGTVFPGAGFEVLRNSFAQVAEMAFGDWTAYEKFNDGSELTYRLKVLPFELTAVDTRYPVISTPANGATVPPEFTIEWKLNDGSKPKSRSFHYHGSPNFPFNFGPVDITDCCTVPIVGTLIGPAPANFDVTAENHTDLPNPQLLDALQTSSNRFFATAQFVSRSALTSFTVVPEPCTSLILAGAGLAASVSRRR